MKTWRCNKRLLLWSLGVDELYFWRRETWIKHGFVKNVISVAALWPVFT